MATILANLSPPIIFSGPCTDKRSDEERNRETDALPTPPDWFRASVITDMRQFMRDYTDQTEEEIEAKQALDLERHRKRDYQRGLKKAGSPEKLKALQDEAHARWEVEHADWIARNSSNPQWCALMGFPAPNNPVTD